MWGPGKCYHCSYPCAPSCHRRMTSSGWVTLSFAISFVIYFLSGQAWPEGERGDCNVPPPRGQRTGQTEKMYAAIV